MHSFYLYHYKIVAFYGYYIAANKWLWQDQEVAQTLFFSISHTPYTLSSEDKQSCVTWNKSGLYRLMV